MQISPLQNISLAESIRRDYEEEAQRHRLARQIEQPQNASLLRFIPMVSRLATPLSRGQ